MWYTIQCAITLYNMTMGKLFNLYYYTLKWNLWHLRIDKKDKYNLKGGRQKKTNLNEEQQNGNNRSEHNK